MNRKTTILAVFTTAIILTATTFVAINPIQIAHSVRRLPTGAPRATSGDNVYIAWWTNKTGNDEVMFRASTDNGATFGDKINLSNSTNADSGGRNIESSGDRVFVTWWESNATSDQPVLRISNDNGKTFGSILKLATNGTLSGSSGG
jgi:predicted PurR-regulated permease PerM